MNIKIYFKKTVSILALTLFFAFAADAQSNRHPKETENQPPAGDSIQTENKSGEDRKLKITKKQPPNVKVFERCFHDYGFATVRTVVKVTFHSSGQVTAVEIVNNSGCQEFDDESLRVARKIEFQPEIKNGEAVTVYKAVIYQGGIR
ncbi:MAG: energy transducer TonB [Acidobacteriota bacterium]|nr:energy transducer TonB [Acidobacteriota bacterium]